MDILNALGWYAQNTLGDQGVEFDVRIGKRLVKVSMSDFEGNFDHYDIPLSDWKTSVKYTEPRLEGLTPDDDEFVDLMDEFCNFMYEYGGEELEEF
jgi:hypothetical protein